METAKPSGELSLAGDIAQTQLGNNGHSPNKNGSMSEWEKLEKILHTGGTYACYWTLDKLFHWFSCGHPGNPPLNYHDVYFSIHPTDTKGDSVSGIKNETVCAINSFYGEFDGKDYIPVTEEEVNKEIQENPSKYETYSEENKSIKARKDIQERVFLSSEAIRKQYKAVALEHVKAIDPPPSYVQDSAGGYHCFWFLTETFYITNEDDREWIRGLQIKWVTFTGADQGSKDLRRVLRVPGTVNTKYSPNGKVTILWFYPDTRYTLSQIDELVQDIEEPKRKSTYSTSAPAALPGTRPIDLWIAKTSWESILESKGWKHLYNKGDKGYWQRPGKKGNQASATTNYKGNDCLHVFSSNAPPFEADTSYKKSTVYVYLNYGTTQNDFTKAAEDIVKNDPEYIGIQDDWLLDFIAEIPEDSEKPVSNESKPEKEEEEQPKPDDFLKIIENEELSTAERLIAVNNLVQAMVETDANILEVAIAGQKVKDAHIPGINKTTFSNAVKEAFKKQASENPADEDHTPTDDEIAGKFLASHPNTVFGMGYFRRYRDGYWPIMEEVLIDREIVVELVRAKRFGMRPTSARIDSVRTILRDVTYKSADEWDKNKNIIVARNGTIEIPSCTLRDHNPKDYATSAVPYDYDPTATSDTWTNVLERLPNETNNDVRGFVQEYSGLCLTTEQKYEIALWFQGERGCGKSTIIEGVKAMLGSGKHCALGLRQIERSNFALTNLPGKTLAVSTEQPSGFFSALDILNAIISGETITVDIKFKDPYDINPVAKLLWAMNDLPVIRDPNNGLFRRVKVVKFAKLNEQDKKEDVKEEVKKSGAAILNWALEGLKRLIERGHFNIPKSVTDATNEFQVSSDVPSMYLADKEFCKWNKEGETKSSRLYEGYKIWCEKNGHKPQSSTSIADDWKRLGLTKKDKSEGAYWQGIEMIYQFLP